MEDKLKLGLISVVVIAILGGLLYFLFFRKSKEFVVKKSAKVTNFGTIINSGTSTNYIETLSVRVYFDLPIDDTNMNKINKLDVLLMVPYNSSGDLKVFGKKTISKDKNEEWSKSNDIIIDYIKDDNLDVNLFNVTDTCEIAISYNKGKNMLDILEKNIVLPQEVIDTAEQIAIETQTKIDDFSQSANFPSVNGFYIIQGDVLYCRNNDIKFTLEKDHMVGISVENTEEGILMTIIEDLKNRELKSVGLELKKGFKVVLNKHDGSYIKKFEDLINSKNSSEYSVCPNDEKLCIEGNSPDYANRWVVLNEKKIQLSSTNTKENLLKLGVLDSVIGIQPIN